MTKLKKGGTLMDTSLMSFIRATPKLLPSTNGVYPASNVHRGYNSLAAAVNNGQKTVGYYNAYPVRANGGHVKQPIKAEIIQDPLKQKVKGELKTKKKINVEKNKNVSKRKQCCEKK